MLAAAGFVYLNCQHNFDIEPRFRSIPKHTHQTTYGFPFVVFCEPNHHPNSMLKNPGWHPLGILANSLVGISIILAIAFTIEQVIQRYATTKP
jgi:hypothetical protein